MKAGGVLLVITGVWILCQVLKGNALERLGLDGAAAGAAPDPTKGGGDLGDLTVPRDPNYKGPTDAWGRPL